MKANPKVSIIIPVYNGSNYVAEAIDSALGQTYSNIEVIVVNDGSCDNGETEDIVLSYKNKVRYFKKENGGVSSALNVGIKNMKGDYFSWLSHDNLYYPNKIKKQINFLKTIKDDKAIVYSDFRIFSKNSKDTIAVRMQSVIPHHFRYWITVVNGLHGCTLLIPKSAFEASGLFNEDLKTTQDYDMWFRLSEKYDFIHMPDILVKSRSHPEQTTHTIQDVALKECDDLLTNFVRRLKRSELMLSTQDTPKLSYANISKNMRSRGFHEASKTAKMLEKDVKNLGYKYDPKSYLEELIALQEQHSLLDKQYFSLKLQYSSLENQYSSLEKQHKRLSSLFIIRMGRYMLNGYRKAKSYVA